jgi:hypothetical protein
MEKETKRALQNLLEIIREQQNTIRDLQHKAKPSTRGLPDGIAERIGRIAEELSEREAFEIDWARLCDRHYAARS